MKKLLVLQTLIWLLLLAGCKDKDNSIVDDNIPQISLTSSKIHSIQGRKIIIEGVVSDPIGIASVNIKNSLWYLDKTIVLSSDSLHKTYHLQYSFLVPDTASNMNRTFTVTITNVGGKKFSADVVVVMDGDFVSPTITVNGAVDNGAVLVPGPSDNFDLKFTFADDRRLSYVVIKEATLALSDSIGNLQGKTYTYTNGTIAIPQKTASYNFVITVADSAGNTVEKKLAVGVSVTWDFAKIYLTDVATKDLLTSDLFGVPMMVERKSAFTYEAKYFAEAANTSIRFVAQKNDFGPNCFGIDPNNSQKLKNGLDALPIILPEIGYYKITISTDPDKLTYAVEKIDPLTDPDRPALYVVNTTADPATADYIGKLGLIGKGFADCPNMSWSPAEIANYPDLQLIQDPTYVYRWTTTVAVSGSIEFIIGPEHPWNWWPSPFWRFDVPANPEATVLGGGSGLSLTVSQKTTYKFVFDQYLNRAKMVKQ